MANLLTFLYEILIEARQIGLSKYFSDPFNWLDSIGYLMGLIWISLQISCFENGEIESSCASNDLAYINLIWTLTVTVRCIDFFFMYDSTRQLTMILIEGVKDVKSFMIILIYILYMFAIVS